VGQKGSGPAPKYYRTAESMRIPISLRPIYEISDCMWKGEPDSVLQA